MTTHPMDRNGGTAMRLLKQLIDLFGPGTQPGSCREREWASATFSGARHSMDFRLLLPHRDAALPAILAALPEHEFALRGEIVADCTLAIRSRVVDDSGQVWLPVTIEILTVTAD